MKDNYLTTPSGELIYRPVGGEEVVKSEDMPSDEKYKGRKNQRGSAGPNDGGIPTCPSDIPPPPPPKPEIKDRPWWDFWR